MVDSRHKHKIADTTHETLWNVSKMNRKSTIYLRSLVKTVPSRIGHGPTSSLAHH